QQSLSLRMGPRLRIIIYITTIAEAITAGPHPLPPKISAHQPHRTTLRHRPGRPPGPRAAASGPGRPSAATPSRPASPTRTSGVAPPPENKALSPGPSNRSRAEYHAPDLSVQLATLPRRGHPESPRPCQAMEGAVGRLPVQRPGGPPPRMAGAHSLQPELARRRAIRRGARPVDAQLWRRPHPRPHLGPPARRRMRLHRSA